MLEKTTDELVHKIKMSQNPEDYLLTHKKELISGGLAEQLNAALRECARSKASVIRSSGLNRPYAYQIFAGGVTPSRDKIIALALGMQLTLDRMQQLLKAVGYRELYARDARDALILFGMQNRQTVIEINERLLENGLKILE